MLEPGVHLTQVSAELAPDVFPKIDVGIGGDPVSQLYSGTAVDDTHGFPTYLAGDATTLEAAMGTSRHRRSAPSQNPDKGFRGRVVPMVDLIAGTAIGRTSDREISASSGVRPDPGKQGLQFVTVSSLVYDRAKAAGLGREVPTEWFLQDIRN
jgi:alanine dehydrogenase